MQFVTKVRQYRNNEIEVFYGNPVLQFELIHDKAVLPKKNVGDVGIDIHCVAGSGPDWSAHNPIVDGAVLPLVTRTNLLPGQRKLFNTGLKCSIPDGYAVLLRDRSGMGAKKGIHVLAGVIDSSYTGEWLVCLVNLSDKVHIINEGDRIVQAILVPDFQVEIEKVETLDKDTERGDKGFGSSGD